eukprot:INCI6292.1.p1 GENE.INCI6292.1~~INCI6292.1.p1  ORF type:complete len:172 (+),score=39.19 INCI6292.1:98-613(+)
MRLFAFASVVALAAASNDDASCTQSDIADAVVQQMTNNQVTSCAQLPELMDLSDNEYTCNDDEAIFQELVDRGLMDASDVSQYTQTGNPFWLLCCQTCHRVADASATTADPKATDTCMSSFVRPCLEYNGITSSQVSQKQCISSALSAACGSLDSAPACFKTMYDYCQTLA